MTSIVTLTWSPQAPGVITTDRRDVDYFKVQEYLDALYRDGEAWRVSYAAYDATLVPWSLIEAYLHGHLRGCHVAS